MGIKVTSPFFPEINRVNDDFLEEYNTKRKITPAENAYFLSGNIENNPAYFTENIQQEQLVPDNFGQAIVSGALAREAFDNDNIAIFDSQFDNFGEQNFLPQELTYSKNETIEYGNSDTKEKVKNQKINLLDLQVSD